MTTGKKRCSSFLCCVFLLLTACASTQNAPPKVLIETQKIEKTPFLIYTDDTVVIPSAAEIFKEQNESISLTLRTVGDQAAQDLRTLLISGAAPDLVYLSAPRDDGIYRALTLDHALYNLADFLSGADAPRLYDGFLDNPMAKPYGDQHITGAPLYYECAGLLAKAKWFSGENALSIPGSLTSFLNLTSSLNADLQLFGYPLDYPAYLEPLVLPLMATVDGTVRRQAQEYTAEYFSGDAMKKLAQNLNSLSPYLYFGEKTTDIAEIYTAFKNDQILFIPGSAQTPDILREEYDMQDEILLFPAPAGGEQQFILTAFMPAYIPAGSAHPELGVQFLSLIYSRSAADYQAYARDGGFVPPVAGSSTSLSGYSKAAAKLFEDGVYPVISSLPSEHPDFLKSFYSSLSDLIVGAVSSEEWTQKMTGLFTDVRAE